MITNTTKLQIINLILIIVVSIGVNQYFGNIGIFPIDSFFPFNASYEMLNGVYPFKDYWTITGPFIDVVQAILFKIFGVNWTTYVLHASIINSILGSVVYYSLINFDLPKKYSLIYSLLTVTLAYPSAGTPYVDHHATILSIISILIFIVSIKKINTNLWYFLPILFFCSFFTKQSPTAYIFLIIGIFYIVFFVKNFFLKKTIFLFLETLIILSLVYLIFYFYGIQLIDFYNQYIDYPLSIGENRFENFLFPFDFKRIFLKHKWLHISLLPLYVQLIKLVIKKNFISDNRTIYFGSLILSSYAFISHQLMTINGNFIFFLIPIYAGFSHSFLKIKNLKKDTLIIIITILVSFYYFNKYIVSRDFMDLTKKDIKLKIDANLLDKKLHPLKWITFNNKTNPKKEIKDLQEVIEIIKSEKQNKSIITDYQFISVSLGINDNSPSKYWYYYHVYPTKDHRLFDYYKEFFLKRLKEKNIKKIFVVKPLAGDDRVVETIFQDACFSKEKKTEILDIYDINKCF